MLNDLFLSIICCMQYRIANIGLCHYKTIHTAIMLTDVGENDSGIACIVSSVLCTYVYSLCPMQTITYLEWNECSKSILASWYSHKMSWWRQQMETFSALLAICAGNSPVPSEFLTQRPVTRSFGVCFDLLLNNRLSKQSWSWWFETLSCPLWRQCNVLHCSKHIRIFPVLKYHYIASVIN